MTALTFAFYQVKAPAVAFSVIVKSSVNLHLKLWISPKRMMPTMTRPAYWNRELLNIPEVSEDTLKTVSRSLGSPSWSGDNRITGSSSIISDEEDH